LDLDFDLDPSKPLVLSPNLWQVSAMMIEAIALTLIDTLRPGRLPRRQRRRASHSGQGVR